MWEPTGPNLWEEKDKEEVLWEDTLGEADFFLAGGEASLEGDTLPEWSSDVTTRLALWELSERSLQIKLKGGNKEWSNIWIKTWKFTK